MPRRLPMTLADYLVIALSPALVIALVGSLVFFLHDLFYRGVFLGRVQFILAMFVFASVLIGRISIEDGWERATMFAVPLAILTWAALEKFVEYPPELSGWIAKFINCNLIVLVWWSTHRLVWDCTVFDQDQEPGGEGLLRALGWDRGKSDQKTSAVTADDPASDGTTAEVAQVRWRELLTPSRRRPSAAGKWVLYYSLAALPIFGFGQWFIPAADAARRRYAFFLLATYVGSGLGLLVTTSFLSLRRYLRARRMPMPGPMAAAWATMGVGMIVAILFFAALFPRPSAEISLSRLPWQSPPAARQQASKYATGKEGIGDENQTGQDSPGDAEATNSPDRANQEDRDIGQGRENGGGEGETSATGGRSAGREGDTESAGERSSSAETGNDSPATTTRTPSSRGKSPSASLLREAGSWLSVAGKYLFYAAMIGAAVAAASIFRQPIARAWQEFWEGLWGLRRRRSLRPAEKEIRLPPPRVAFSQIEDPFLTGKAARWPPRELVRYTFAAVEAWAEEQGMRREEGETPHEFVRRLGSRVTRLESPSRRLADLYSLAAYANRPLPSQPVNQLQDLWRLLRETADACGSK